MKLGIDMHLPKEDCAGDNLSGDFFDVDLTSIFGSSSGEKDANSSLDTKFKLCPQCLLRGEHSYLAPFQLNFDEAIYLCPVQSCSYPMHESNLVESFVVKRDATTLPASASVKSTKKSRRSSGFSTFFDEFNPDVEFPEFAEALHGQPPPDISLGQQSQTGYIHSSKSPTEMEEIPERMSPAQHGKDSIAAVSSTCDASDTWSKTCSDTEEDRLSEQTNVEMENIDMNVSATAPSPSSITGTTEASSKLNQPKASKIGNSGQSPDPNSTMDITQPDSESSDICLQHVEDDKPQAGRLLEAQNVSPNDSNVCLDQPEGKLSRPPVFEKMLQWANEGNSCWLDAIMQVIVSSTNSRAVLNASNAGNRSHLNKLIIAYDKCQQMFQEHSQIKEPVGDIMANSMNNMRKHLFNVLKEKSPIETGEFQSLLEMFPLVLKVDSAVESLFKVQLLWDFQCKNCGHRRARRSRVDVVSISQALPDFHPLNARFHRHCYDCKSPGGTTTIHMEKLPPCLMFHFQKGLPHSNLQVLDFAVQGQLYSVFAVVQYVLTPLKHFITWIRDKKVNKWRRCNDLEDPVCSWQTKRPQIPPKEVHMVFWERQLSCEAEEAQMSDVATVLNEEAVALGDEIPLELFFAHEEDETIVIPEDENFQKNNEKPDQNIRSQLSQCDSQSCHMFDERKKQVFAAATTSGPEMPSSSIQDLSVSPDSTQQGFATSPQIASASFQFSPTMFQNGGMTILPNGAGGQMIQLVAPANTCSIFIVTNDNKNQQPIYIGPPNAKTSAFNSSATPCSFIDNPHCFNMVSQGIHGSVSRSGKTNLMSSQRPKRQYRLSGYSKANSASRFSPMKVSKKPHSGTTSQKSSVDAQSEHSYNSKKDSETLSEVSELSDNLPDFEFETNSSRHSSATTSSMSLPHSNSTTPTNSIK